MTELHAKVRSAAVAGWWTVLVAIALQVLLWLAYLVFVKPRPMWVLDLVGLHASWATVQTVWLYMLAVYRLMVTAVLLVAIWLTLWARQLGKQSRALASGQDRNGAAP
jgi:hypothetical protein